MPERPENEERRGGDIWQREQLPGGKHGLPRQVVAAHQRERILQGLTQAVVELGYARTTVADVITFAKVSRKTFYEHFNDKEDCFLAAYDAAIERIARHVIEAIETKERPGEQLSVGIAAFIELMAAEPALARLCLVEVIALGPVGLERRERAIRAFAHGMLEIARQHEAAAEVPPITAELVIGGLLQIANARLVRGDVETLRRDMPELVYCALVPFCGHDEATELTELLGEGNGAPLAAG